MLSYEEFKEMLLKRVKSSLPDRYRDAEVQIVTVPKNNDRTVDEITVHIPNSNTGPAYQVKDIYAHYVGSESFEAAFVSFMRQMVMMLDAVPSLDIGFLKDWEQAKDRIVPELVSMRKNCENLSQAVYREVEGTDLAISYRIRTDIEEIGIHGSVRVNREMMEGWGVDENRIHGRAFHNMNRLLTPEIVELGPAVDRGEEPQIHSELPEKLHKGTAYIFTNREGFYGAAAIMAAGMMREIAERLQGSYYLLPMDVDHMAVLPQVEGMDAESLQELVLTQNIMGGNQEIILSDQIYFYDKDKGALSMATDPKQTQEAILRMLAEAEAAGLEGAQDEGMER